MNVRVRTLAVVALACATSVTLGTLAQSSLGAFGSGSLPAPRITSAPLRASASGAATFAFRGMPGTTTECSLDSGSWARCSSPVTYRRLAFGVHAFRVRVRAAVGDPSAAATFAWPVVPRRTRPVLRPVFTTVPKRPWTSRQATFAWMGAHRSFECRLDGRAWARCRSPRTFIGLSLGTHVFRVRALRSPNRRSSVNRFTWTIARTAGRLERDAFPGLTVSGSPMTPLTPGSSIRLPLTLTSTYDEPITVTSIVVTVDSGSSAAGCDGQANLAITQSNANGGAVSLVVPPHGSVTLPIGDVTAPSVRMLDLATDQSACKGATFTLTYSAFGSGG